MTCIMTNIDQICVYSNVQGAIFLFAMLPIGVYARLKDVLCEVGMLIGI